LKLTETQAENIVKALKFRDGLVTAVARDFETKDVLMVAMQDRRAVLKTLTTGLMYYWSRSRGKLWLKGEQSGHYQKVRKVLVDCDGDVLLFDVEQVGVACHEGYRSCFYREVRQGELVTVLKRKFRPEDIYGRRAAK
jgi:phosphoribosyl-AMP cyclohydrolase